jgi:hypothetical protein
MHTFINSRAMAQLVALDLMAEEASRAQARRSARDRRRAGLVAAGLTTPAPAETGRPRRRIARALRLAH